mmetsp:Transcript_3627/g.7505  ORF Transcript_3627/g.7505 Transcript_3627/m.7505 type:complete len:394 (-) Transcript_3627:33-1214(-)|eukprot:CAMPEP_0194307108 /NCGR_PEP_ID=MMETSP0171-20130528/3984_1 /TAXON_ID=218684 /ORGANISM="Corethron pennatum, Strain L29A3" /LENGTH=393 /DNA_ID=CAMNT_0039059001 /DNA_START=94 /DNA_END=1275 /DNA_ORIENTATION=+
MSPSLSTTLSTLSLPSCVMNASGPRTGSAMALSKIASSASGAVVSKSATIEAQNGNPIPRTWKESEDGTGSALNSEGLPNKGIDYYISKDTAQQSGGGSGAERKPYIVSISGKNLDNNLEMMRRILAALDGGVAISAVELNLACPNVIGKPIIAYDFVQMETVLSSFSKLLAGRKKRVPMGVKMPPYFDAPHFRQAADIINKYRHVVSYVATINTVGNALHIDVDALMPTISSNDGYAGLSGAAVKHIALSNVRRLRSMLHADVDVVGVGGVQSGQDAFEMILCGATAVQVGTCHWSEGAGCFDRICAELKEIMAENKFKSIEDLKGKILPWSKAGAAKSRAVRKKRDDKAKSIKEKEEKENQRIRNAADFYKLLCAILIVVIAFLADKLRKS